MKVGCLLLLLFLIKMCLLLVACFKYHELVCMLLYLVD